MRSIFGLVLIIGIGLAGFAVYLAKGYIGTYEKRLAQEQAVSRQAVKTVEIYVAAKQLKYGDVLDAEAIKKVRYSVESLSPGHFIDEELLLGETGKPRYVLRTIEPMEALLAIKLTEPGEAVGVTSRLAPGMRAFALKVDVSSGVSGFLRPGDKVDVYWTGRPPRAAGSDGNVTRLIETGVELIAVDQSASSDNTETLIARTVTVAATPQQVAALAQAQNTGRLSLSLLGNDDTKVAQEVIEIDQMRLLGIAEAAPEPEVKKEEECKIRTRKGGELVEIEIPCTN